MYVQWCIKGITGEIGDAGVQDIFRGGLLCNWWRNHPQPPWDEVPAKLTDASIDLHVNGYDQIDPATGAAFHLATPFISLSAGAVDRDTMLRNNVTHPAHETALRFATDDGRRTGYLFYCWVIVGLNPAVGVEPAAEEIRELNSIRQYSDWQLEGEITAKLRIPPSQISRCETHVPPSDDQPEWQVDVADNPLFVPPDVLLNLRQVL